MGGGDTQLAKLSVVVRLRPPKRLDGGERAVWIEGDEVHVSDAAKASDLNKPGGDRVYQVTRALPAHASQRDTYVAAALPAIDFVWEGFNASIMAMGQVRVPPSCGLLAAMPGGGVSSQEASLVQGHSVLLLLLLVALANEPRINLRCYTLALNAHAPTLDQVGTGKTRTLFGGGGQEGLCEVPSPPSLSICMFLHQLLYNQPPPLLSLLFSFITLT